MRGTELLLITLLGMMLLSCAATEQQILGTYAIYGRVLDRHSGEPIEGAKVTASFSSGSMKGAFKTIQGVAITNADGKFYIPSKEFTTYGSRGRMSGHTSSLPSVWVNKEGYCSLGLITDLARKNKELVFDLGDPNRDNCRS